MDRLIAPIAAAGATAGLAAALALSRVAASLLYGTTWMDPVVYVSVLGVLLVSVLRSRLDSGAPRVAHRSDDRVAV